MVRYALATQVLWQPFNGLRSFQSPESFEFATRRGANGLDRRGAPLVPAVPPLCGRPVLDRDPLGWHPRLAAAVAGRAGAYRRRGYRDLFDHGNVHAGAGTGNPLYGPSK